LPQSLFVRTALLLAGTILVFAILAWQAVIWTAIGPAAELAAPLLTQRAHAAIAARRAGQPLPEGTRFETVAPESAEPRLRGFAFRTYVETIQARLHTNLHTTDIRIHRLAGPSEIWLQTPDLKDAWLVLTWRLADPKAPMAALGLLAAAALLVLGAAAFSARRLTAPLAALAAAATQLADGEEFDATTEAGPREVRALALALQSTSHRLAEQDQQRELMLAGISHDLRTPLARLQVAVELLDPGDPALLTEMTANIEEMDRMLGQFLHYVRANYHEKPAPARIDEVVCQAVGTYTSDRRLQLDLNANEIRPFAVECLRHALLNLVQNALEYGKPPVIVRTAIANDRIQIQVQDGGEGLTPADWNEAVRPFHRLRDQPGGIHTGLGLALVDRLVRVSGGTLEAARSADGFVVTVRLPASHS
jgi:two-component system osmolarity sensor histidine kinase EnvZ